MANLFEQSIHKPLADLLRPQFVDDIVGQEHLLGERMPIQQMLSSHKLSSMILWGPPGCGKTTLARAIAKETNYVFESISAIMSGVADLRKVFEKAQLNQKSGMQTLLFVDEIHRFNRAQQDSFLLHVEEGGVTLIGATTENPSFELNSALLSRCQVFILKPLNDDDQEALLQKAEKFRDQSLPVTKDAREMLKHMSGGDGRMLLNYADVLFSYSDTPLIDGNGLQNCLQKKLPQYDKKQDSHYNLISALHKSLRGSDPDAALYWFARMIDGGEDPLYIARRLIRFASEDVGLADPQALQLVCAAQESYKTLGSPEGELALAQAVLYLATAPKSNAAYVAYKMAMQSARQNSFGHPPMEILNAPTKLMKENGYGEGYIYDHDLPTAFSGQNYFPESMARERYYQPVQRGFEREIQKRLDYWTALRNEKKMRKKK